MTSRAIEARGSRDLLARLLETPNLPQVVKSLDPEILYQLVRTCGLEDSGEIVSLATADQLMRVFDRDLWGSARAGMEDQFDADRFGLWLEVLVEAGVAIAAQRLVEMDFDFVAAAMSRHILVPASTVALGAEGAYLTKRKLEDGVGYDIGGYTVVVRRSQSWDALLSVLVSLEADHKDFFHRLMRRCCQLSSEVIEDNGLMYEVLNADEQIMSDVAFGREQRREGQGYVTPSQAVAFLDSARRLDFGQDLPGWDHATISYFRQAKHQAEQGDGEANNQASARRDEPPRAESAERGVAEVLSLLREAGVVQNHARPGLPGGTDVAGSRLARIRTHLQVVQRHDGSAYSRRMDELGYLGNVLIAGCSFNSRGFGAAEAPDAVFAVCNLGLENWPRHWRSPEKSEQEFLIGQDLVTMFRVGWTVLYEQVSLYVARRLAEILSELTFGDAEVQAQLDELALLLRRQVKAGTPWRAQNDLDAVAILDQPSWLTLLGLLDQCPVVPKIAEKRGDARRPLRRSPDVEFISENSQLQWVRDFVESLPDLLLG